MPIDHTTIIDQLFENVDFSKQDVQILESDALQQLSTLEHACISRLSDLYVEQCPKLLNLLDSISDTLLGIKDRIYYYNDRLSNTSREIQQIDSFRTLLQLQIINQKKLLDLLELIISHFGRPDELVDIIRFSKLDSKELESALLSLSSILETISGPIAKPQFTDLCVLGDLKAIKERIQYVNQLISVFSGRLYDRVNQIQSIPLDEKSQPCLEIKKYSHLISKLKTLDSRHHLELETLYEQKTRKSYESIFISRSDRIHSPKDTLDVLLFKLVECIIQEGRTYLECFHGIVISNNTQNLDSKTSRKTFAFLKSTFESIQEHFISKIDSSLVGSTRTVAALEGYMENQARNSVEYEWIESTLSGLFYRLAFNFDESIQLERNTIQQSTISLRKKPYILSCVSRAADSIGKMEQYISAIPSIVNERIISELYSVMSFRDASITKDSTKTRIRRSYYILIKEIFDLFDQFEAGLSEEKELIHMQALCIRNYHSMYTSLRELRLEFLNTSCVKPCKAKYEEKLKELVQLLIRTSFAPLLGFFEGVETSLRISSPEDIKFHPRYGKTVVRNLLQQYSGKEVKRIVESLQDRIKQLLDADEFSISLVVVHDIQNILIAKMKSWCKILDDYYNSKDPEALNSSVLITFQFTLDELVSFFK